MKPTLNLATRTYLNRRLLYLAYSLAIGALLLVLCGFGYYFVTTWQATRSLQTSLDKMQRESLGPGGGGAVRFSTEDYQQLRRRIAFFNDILARDTFRWTDLLDRLEGLLPAGVALRSIQPDFNAGSLRISGLTRNLDKLQEFLDNLLQSKDFSGVYLLKQAQVKAGAKQATNPSELSFSLVLEGAF